MQGKTLSDAVAREAVEAFRRDPSHVVPESECRQTGDGDPWDESRADRLADELRASKHRIKGTNASAHVVMFDAPACGRVHELLDLPPNLAAADGFWRWLAVAKCPDVIEARHVTKSEPAKLANFGIGESVTRNRLAILWFRADMTYDANADDPYHLATRPMHTDFLESGIIRHRYGWCRNLARALVRFQYPDPSSNRRNLGPDGIRELYKRLRRLHSAIAFEFLSDEELAGMLVEQSAGLRRS